MALLKVKKDPPVKTIYKADDAHDTTADVRDILSNLAGKGYKSMSDQNAHANYISLSKLVGQPAAQKLVTQAFLFNQRPEAATMSPEQRIQTFYDIGSNDKEVAAHLQKAKALGSGPLAGFKDSVLDANQALQGRGLIVPTGTGNTLAQNTAAQALLRTAK